MHHDSTTPDTIPYGYCHCGCGELTTVAQKTDRRACQVRGEPIKFRPGHNTRLRRAGYIDSTTKICSKCGSPKGVSEFYRDRATYDGLSPYCIECAQGYGRRWRQENPEKFTAGLAKWREQNRERVLAYGRAYHKANAEHRAIQKRAYNKANAKRTAETHKRWVKRNPESNRIRCQARRARQLVGGGRVSAKEWKAILAAFDGKCAKCGSSENIHMDHVVPLAKGGKHDIDNIQPLCATCNMRKHTKVEDYRGKLYRPAALPLDDMAD